MFYWKLMSWKPAAESLREAHQAKNPNHLLLEHFSLGINFSKASDSNKSCFKVLGNPGHSRRADWNLRTRMLWSFRTRPSDSSSTLRSVADLDLKQNVSHSSIRDVAEFLFAILLSGASSTQPI